MEAESEAGKAGTTRQHSKLHMTARGFERHQKRMANRHHSA